MKPPDVSLIICLSSGFGTKVYARSGIRRLYRYCRTFANAHTEIMYDVWNGGWSGTARRIHQVATEDSHCVFIAHSWGCGLAFRKFAKQWRKLGRVVDLAILIDPVPRPFKLLIPLNIFAMTHWGKFKVKGVREVLAFHQYNNRPCGHRVVNSLAVEINQTALGSPEVLDKYAPWAVGGTRVVDEFVRHGTIDDHNVIHKEIHGLLDSKIKAWRHGR